MSATNNWNQKGLHKLEHTVLLYDKVETRWPKIDHLSDSIVANATVNKSDNTCEWSADETAFQDICNKAYNLWT